MLSLQFYTRQDCTLCDSALALMRRLQKRIPFELELIDVDTDAALLDRFGNVVPVVTSGNQELARSFFDEKKLLAQIRSLRSKA